MLEFSIFSTIIIDISIYVTAHEKRDLPRHLVVLCNKPKCSKNWSRVKIQITLVLWTTILCLPCGEVTTVMRALVCPGEAFTFHDCELFEAVIHCVQRRCGHVTSTVTMAMGTAASRILKKTILPKSFIKQSYHLERVFLSLGWHWKGVKKRKKTETIVSIRSGRGHTSCDFMHKWSQVWYTEMFTRQWLSTIKRIFLCKMIRWWHTCTGTYPHNRTARAFYGCKVKKSVNCSGRSLFSCAVTYYWNTTLYLCERSTDKGSRFLLHLTKTLIDFCM